MQATITYLLTEQAQRAQMAATGQPIARKQTVTIDLPADQAATLQVNDLGVPYLDLSGPYPGPSISEHRWRNLLDLESISDGKTSNAFAGFRRADPDFPALIAAVTAKIAAEQQYDIAYPAGVLASDATLAEWVRSRGHDSNYDKNIWRSAIESNGLKPIDSRLYGDEYISKIVGPLLKQATAEYLTARAAEEKRRRDDSDAARKIADEKRRATEATIEAEKQDFIKAWIVEHAEPEIQEQYRDGLLCRKVAVSLIAASVLDPIGPAMEEPSVCEIGDCPCHGLKSVDCIPRAKYPSWKEIKSKLPVGSTFEFSSYRECLRDEDGYFGDRDESAGPTRYAVTVNVPHGPFTFERSLAL